MKQPLTASDRLIIIIPAFLFWLIVPVPFWLLGMGFAGELVLWPSFGPDVWFLSLLWVFLFYGPLLLIAAVAAEAIKSRPRASEPKSRTRPKP